MEISAALWRRIEAALARAAESRIGGVASLAGNPLDVETRQFGRLTATAVRRPALYYGFYSAVRGFGSGEYAEDIEPALTWLRGQGVTPWLTLSPVQGDATPGAELKRLGLRQVGEMSVVLAEPKELTADGMAEVMEAALGERHAFEALWLDEVPSDQREFSRRLCEAEFGDWRVFVALEGGEPAAHGCLYLSDGAGVLASGWTRPASRGRGLQSALIRARVASAAMAGCDLAISTAVPGSQSERNLLRLGFKAAYQQSVWSV